MRNTFAGALQENDYAGASRSSTAIERAVALKLKWSILYRRALVSRVVCSAQCAARLSQNRKPLRRVARRERFTDAIDLASHSRTTSHDRVTRNFPAAGFDYRCRGIGYERGIQGNLDPTLLLTSWETIEAGMRDVLRRANNRPGHIFNLGHGVLAPTDPEMLIRLVEAVHETSARS